MIRIVTKKRLALLEADTAAAFERAQRAKETALLDAARHPAALADVTERAERAEALHYGTPVMVYRSREDAYADTATHGVPADVTWQPSGRRFWADAEWSVSTFMYDADARGFRGALEPVAEPVRGAA